MAQVTFESIKPLIQKQELRRGTVYCTFTCPESGVTADASAPIPRGEGVKDRALDKAKDSLMYSLRRQLQRTVYSFLGSSMGRVASDVLGEGMNAAADKVKYSQEQVEAAVADAFQKTAGKFHWDPARRQWLGGERGSAAAPGDPAAGPAAPAGPSFLERLQQAPLTAPADRQLLARMLVTVARADGELAAEEQQFLGGFMGMPPEAMAQIAKQGEPTPADLQQASPGPTRETAVLLLWALAMCDEELHAGEEARVRAFGEALGLAAEQVNVLRDCAADHVVQAALTHVYGQGAADEATRARVGELAEGLGMSPERLQGLDERVRAQLGAS